MGIAESTRSPGKTEAVTDPRATASARVRAWAAVALVAYGAVVVALTMLKAFYVIGMLWRPEAQRNRSVEWVPFTLFRDSATWFGPLFDSLGNMAFFIPLGVLLYILLERTGRGVGVVVVVGALISATVETLQYVLALGHTDVTDLLFNTGGALVGAVIARACGRRAYPVWIGLALVTALVFAALVALGPRLGDPDKVVEMTTTTAGATPPG